MLSKGRLLDAKELLKLIRGPNIDIEEELAEIMGNSVNNSRESASNEEASPLLHNAVPSSTATSPLSTRAVVAATPSYPEAVEPTRAGTEGEGGGEGYVNESTPGESFGILDLFKSPRLRKPFIAALSLQIAQQFSGINIAIYYSTTIFKESYSEDLAIKFTLIVSVVNLVMTLVSMVLIERLGRKILILTSVGLMAVFSIALLVVDILHTDKVFKVVALVLFVASFGIGLGAIPWLILPELIPTYAIGPAASVCTAVNWGCNFLVGLLSPIGFATSTFFLIYLVSRFLTLLQL